MYKNKIYKWDPSMTINNLCSSSNKETATQDSNAVLFLSKNGQYFFQRISIHAVSKNLYFSNFPTPQKQNQIGK